MIANLYASNGQRNPYFKGGARGVVVNNLINNPGSAAIHYGLQLGEWACIRGSRAKSPLWATS